MKDLNIYWFQSFIKNLKYKFIKKIWILAFILI